MKIDTKSDFNIDLEDQNQIINNFLIEAEKKSTNTYRGFKTTLTDYFDFVNRNIKDLDINDTMDYFNYLEARQLEYSSKMQYKSRLTSFFEYYQAILYANHQDFRIPIPNSRIFSFTKNEKDYKIEFENNEIFNDNELIALLAKALKKSLIWFIIFALIIVCGMRISELLTIKTMNINLKERYIITGIVKDAKKQDKPLIFFFPEKLIRYLNLYLSQNGNNVYLFPARDDRNRKGYYRDSPLRRFVSRNFGDKYTKFQDFRKNLITNRILRMNCPGPISELLVNHKINSTEWNYYIKISLSKRRELYDKFFPYSSVPYF